MQVKTFTVLVEMRVEASDYDDVDHVIESLLPVEADYYIKWRKQE